MGFVAGLILVVVLALVGSEFWELYKKDKRRREIQKRIEEEERESKRSRLKIWGGDEDFWDK